MIELKPCPFCGSEAEPVKAHTSYKTPYVIVCKACGASVGNFAETKEKAIEAWNRREPIDKIVKQLRKHEIKWIAAHNYAMAMTYGGAIRIIQKGGK